MKNSLLILLLLITLPNIAQSKFNFGFDLGVVTSQFPVRESKVLEGTDLVTEWKYAPVSPVLGMNGQYIFNSKRKVSLGLQYQFTGYRLRYHRDGRVPRDFSKPEIESYTIDRWERNTFHKISIPFMAEYTIDRIKFQPTILFGIKPNLFLDGLSYKKSVINSTVDEKNSSTENDAVIGFDGSLKRFRNQIIIGITEAVGEQMNISFTYSQGLPFMIPIWEEFPKPYTNSDIMLNLTYVLNKKGS